MKPEASLHAVIAALSLTLLAVMSSRVQAQSSPDLTTAGAIAALKADTNANPRYNETYNLGPTGLRGWIYVGGGSAGDGTFTDASRQILVTVASSPGNAVLAVDDVILGAMAASSGTVPNFSSDCRKAFGAAITDAEKTGAGTLRVKRWRAGTTTDVNVPITIMGNYTATAPYSCPKSSLILTNARNKLVGQLLADSNFLTNDWAGAISGLALLAGVQSGDPNYATVQTRLQTYARAMATAGPLQGGLPTWDWAYSCLFLAEYYLSTNDANVLPGIAAFVNQLVQSQSIYGTFGHGPAALHPDGSGRLISTGYGPVNSVGIVASMAIVMGKKALVAGSQTINPNIDPAIQRGSDYFAWYANKGSIPYGEHEPWTGNHESNGKDPMCAVFFGLQTSRTVETEYFTRMSIAGFNSRESGHTGQGFSYLWGALGANMGGSLATAEYLKNVRWHLDLSRRSDGSFVYDGREGYGPGSTADGTYLGTSSYFGLNPTASYILTYSLPLQRLFITGKSANPANTLDSTKVAHAISAATFKQQSPSKTNSELITALSDFDPIVRNYAAIELGKRSPSAGELITLRGMVTGTDANARMGACQVLGYLKDGASLSLLNDRLDKTTEPNSWVRAKAANAIREFPPATASIHRDSLLSRFVANATDPDVIDWDDPIQISNGFLGFALFGDDVYGSQINNGVSLAAYTINAPKNLLYPAIQTGLKQPDSKARLGPATFCDNQLPLADVQALIPDFFELVQSEVQADRMWGAPARTRGINILSKFKIREGIPLMLSLLDVPTGFTWDAYNYIKPALNAMESYGDAARWTLPTLNGYLNTWDPQNTNYQQQSYPTLVSTTAAIENAITAPAQNLGLAVANPQVVSTTGAKAVTLTGTSPRSTVTFTNVTAPAHGTLAGTAPNLTYTPNSGYSGPDSFTFQVLDSLGAANPSAPGTVAIIVGTAGTGMKSEYFDNIDFTNLKLTRTDPLINFDWGTGSPDPTIGADTFSTRWSGFLLAPEAGTYTLSGLTSDGFRAFLNGVPVINNLNDQSTHWTDGQSISLTAGQKVPLYLEYYENTGSAVAKLKWTGPSFAGLNGDIIPQAYLFDSNSTGAPDTTPPAIIALNPADNATGVAHATDFVATFSENIVIGTGNITIKILSDATQTVIPVTDATQVTVLGATLVINPTALLPGSKNHAIRIDATAIDDTAGNSFAGIITDTAWNFTTTTPDLTAPTPNPMSFAVPPITAGSTSISMTATTASDPSGVEYRFNNLTLGTSSPWQNSPVLTATGLSPSTNYTFTVQARDKSGGGNTTTASAPAGARTLATGPLDVMSINFYAYGPFAPANYNTVTLEAGESAGLGIFHVSGWQNYAVPWGPSSPAAPYTLTSSIGSTATMILNDVRNGGPYRDAPHTFFAGGDGDLMGAHANGTEDPYDQTQLFNMDVSNITYPSYDLIVYLGANYAQFGDGKGKFSINGGAAQDFTLRSGEFSGFVEITDATTPGNYIVFRGLTNPSVNLKVWGNGFNHMGPAGFQIVNYGAIAADTIPPAISSISPADNATGVAVGTNLVATFSENIAIGAGNITLKNLTDGTQTIIAVTDTTQISVSGSVLTINPTADLAGGKNYAVQIATTAIKDQANNNFAGISNDTTWNFATVDTIAPTITSFSPPNGSTGVARGMNFVATFSEPIVGVTGNITIRNTSASPNTSTTIAVTNAQITISGNVLTINPTADLLANTSYAIRIAATCIADTAGNGFAGFTNNTTWSFTTGANTTDTTAPTPNPMTFASPPAAVGPTSISMTATTATDPSGVEYRFNNVPLATSSPWQDSAAYTATGLNPATSYNFTVQARDKSPAQNTTTASAPASATTQNGIQPMDRFNVNLYSYGEYSSANYSKVTLEAGESAGVGSNNVTGWQNIEVPFGLNSPMSPVSISSNLGLSASFTLKDLRNGWTYDSTPNTNVTGGNADLMNSHANGTEDPYDGSNLFDMEVTGIPYQVYDLIVYLGANQAQFGDGTGKLVMNGGPQQSFTLTSGEFTGFSEITNATTPGNYIIFRGLRNAALTLKVWGNGFNHIGPTGFQIVKDVSGLIPPGPAGNPSPPDASVGHAANTDLSWTGGLDATSRKVYFGTNPTPGASELLGTQTATTYDPGNLANGTYYWRIDEINADGTTPGPVWSFSVGPPAKAFRPMPWNGMSAVATNVGIIKWVAGASATPSSHDVYFGTDSTPDATEFIGNQSGTTHNPGTLIPGTTYYWRIDEVNAQGTTTGDVWSFTTPGTGSNKVKVFILAGQSNMEGQGEMTPGTTPGTLQNMYDSNPVAYAHLKSGSNWAVRSDVWAWFRRDGGALQNGGLTAGYGANTSTIGPELQFGHIMGDYYGEKVLLIKTAWGGKSLRTDFRPPSSGWSKDVPVTNGDEGYYFKQTLDTVVDVLANLQTYFPTHNPADGFEIAGFGWHQGWNDRVTPAFSAEYEVNMARFIRDVRSAVGVPAMPFVIGTTGMDGTPDYSEVELAQLQMENFTAYPDFNGNVAVVDTQSFWFPVSQSPADQGYHWNRNAASYYKIGNAMGLEMKSLIVAANNTAPVATAQSVSTAEDTAKAITLAGTDAENSALTYSIVTQPGSGTLSGTAPNVTYTPAANFNGTTSFTFKVNDGIVDSAPATVSITVTAVNDAPVANAQSVSTAEDTAKAITLSGSDGEGSALTYTIVTPPASGTLSGTAPNMTYTPAANYNGAASFTFKVNDGTVDSAPATVSITVTAVNDAPVATAQSVSTAEDTAKAITLSGSDVEGSTLTYTIVTPPANGTLGGTAPNLTYTPAANYNGAVSFTFKVNDGTVDSSPATVSITVTAVNDPPVASPQTVSTVQDTAKAITLAGTDVEGSLLTYAIVTPPVNGALSGTSPNVTYTPAANYLGSDSFTFRVNDGSNDSAAATVSITVGINGQITWGAATAITGAGNIQSAGLTNLAGANFGITTGTTTIVPASETGTVSVEFRSLLSGQNVTLSNGINVAADSTWGNWGANANNSAVTGNFGTVLDSNLGIETGVPVSPLATITLSNLTIGAQYRFQFFADSTGSNSQTISGSAAINSQNGQFVTGTFTADATSRVLTVTRSTDFAVANALTIGTVDTTPPTLASGSIVDNKGGGPVTANTLVTYTVAFSKDMDASTVSAADFGNAGTSLVTIGAVAETSPTSGVFTVPVTPTSTGTLRLRVNAGAVINDAAGNALVTTAAIVDDTTITVANTPPVANGQGVSTAEDTATGITLTGSDADGNSLTFAIVSPPANGSLSGTAPNVTYTPAANFNGPDSFTFKVNDGTVDSAPATVSITVTAVNDAPVATAQSVSTAEDAAKAITLVGTDTENSALTYTIVTQPANGSLSGTAPNVTYTPAANYNGPDSFTFRVNDGTVDSAPATVSITVTAVNDAPVANAQSVTTAEDTAKAISLTGADTENSALTYTIVAQPASGSLSGTPPDVTYTPTSNYNGSDSFTFKCNDGTVDSPPATVSITVTAVNDAPGFATDPFVGSGATQNIAYSGSLVGSAADPDHGDTLTFSKTGGPAWLTVGGDGTLGGTPGSGDVGLNQFTVRATDGGLLFGEATLRISVLSAYESWILKFPGANLADPNSDNDHDGLSNFEEWVWGLDPTNANARNPISVPLNPQSGVVAYTRPNPLLTGISYSVWTSNDLLNWSEDRGAVQTPGGIVNGVQTVTVTLSPEFRNFAKLFVQVRGTK